ncbi:MFS transporter [Priestia koreensis]|uniref:MFS transporter n=1 Tax=Priestia koreensis TaxID=284581 RepID=UPI001F56F305|nr:major facilitator superfamily domain-containing protein 6 [Priestia koreensis]UNL84540.1 MFS transporter [Priestia koreensis]
MEVVIKKQRNVTQLIFCSYYFMIFFGIGSFSPLLTVYLTDIIHLKGTQIGMITSMSPVVMIFAQPLWGVLADYTQKSRVVLTVTLIFTAAMGIAFSFMNAYTMILFVAALLAFFQSSLVPLSDSISLNYVQRTKGNYGSIRLWGAVGFAVAVLIVGRLSEEFGLHIIFYVFACSLLIASAFAWQLPKESQTMRVNVRSGVAKLFRIPKFVLFLMTTFLVFGPIFANNFYFGLYITTIGGTLTGVGIAFLLAAGSEAPFMKISSLVIRKFGIMQILCVAGATSFVRWGFYFIEPPLALVYATTILQGISIGLFIPSALEYVRSIAPNEVKVTAVSLYSAVGNGLGSWFCAFFGGIIIERYSITVMYGCFSIMTLIGLGLILVIWKLESRQRTEDGYEF